MTASTKWVATGKVSIVFVERREHVIKPSNEFFISATSSLQEHSSSARR
jgi:hypothetical protein